MLKLYLYTFLKIKSFTVKVARVERFSVGKTVEHFPLFLPDLVKEANSTLTNVFTTSDKLALGKQYSFCCQAITY